MFKKLYLFIFILITFSSIYLLSCSSDFININSTPTIKSKFDSSNNDYIYEENINDLLKNITSEDGIINITLPDGWVNLNGEFQCDSSLKVSNKKMGYYLITILEPKDINNNNLSCYNDCVLNNIKEMLHYNHDLPTKYNKINSYNCYFSEFITNLDGINVIYFYNIFESDKYYGQLIGITSANNADNYKDLFNRISNTLIINE